MNNSIYVNLVFEDDLSYCIMDKLLYEANTSFKINRPFPMKGRGDIQKNINGYNNASRAFPWFVLVDLDTDKCAPQLKRDWLSAPEHHNLIFRVAIREVESWLLADAGNISSFLGVPVIKIPRDVDDIDDPKRTLINIARKSRRKHILDDIVPLIGSTATQGRNYNARICQFVIDHWDIEKARQHSQSLNRAFIKLKNFTPSTS